jgi:hypothetical protein
MQEFLKIRIELFYIAFFRTIGWLLSRDKVEVERRKLGLMQAECFPKPTPVPVSLHGVAVPRADRKREPRQSQLVFRVEENPVTGNPFPGVLPQAVKIRPLRNAVRSGKAERLFRGFRLTSKQLLRKGAYGLSCGG